LVRGGSHAILQAVFCFATIAQEMIIFYSGPILALLSALLFGVSPVLIKMIAGDVPPILMAGVLYLGSGLGLLLLRLLRSEPVFKNLRIIPSSQKIKLIGAIISGGILAPVCLIYGIRFSSSSKSYKS